MSFASDQVARLETAIAEQNLKLSSASTGSRAAMFRSLQELRQEWTYWKAIAGRSDGSRKRFVGVNLGEVAP
jgi:hypothetical protein